MDTIKAHLQGVKMIAHRGLSGIERENTVAAFVAAGNRSFYGIETDARITADGKYMLLHDSDPHRVAPHVTGVTVEGSTCEALREIVLTDTDGSLTRNDLRIPMLTDYLKICRTYDKVCVLELKLEHNDEQMQALIDLVRSERELSKVIFISFSRDNCITLRHLLPEQEIQWLVEWYTDEVRDTLLTHRLGLDIGYSSLTPEIVAELHAHGLSVNCWTCDDLEEAKRLAAMGVDYITTNIVE